MGKKSNERGIMVERKKGFPCFGKQGEKRVTELKLSK